MEESAEMAAEALGPVVTAAVVGVMLFESGPPYGPRGEAFAQHVGIQNLVGHVGGPSETLRGLERVALADIDRDGRVDHQLAREGQVG